MIRVMPNTPARLEGVTAPRAGGLGRASEIAQALFGRVSVDEDH
jgi:hypothetical protein